MRTCPRCGGSVEAVFRFCPWCAAPRRAKLVEFFASHPRDSGKALRVSRYIGPEPQVRFSVWTDSGVAEGAVSLDEDEASRLAGFLASTGPRGPRRTIDRLLAGLRRPPAG
jgi:hypothetical protein